MMYELFPNWMSKISPQIDQAKLTLRWNAVKAVADSASKVLAVQLCEQALGQSADATEILRAAARKEDATYVSTNDTLELGILAAGAVASLIANKATAGNTAGIAVVTSSFGRSNAKVWAKDLLLLAVPAVQEFGESARLDVSVPAWVGKAILDVPSKHANASDVPSIHAGIAELSQAVVSSLKPQLQKLSEALKFLSQLQRESSDLAFLLVSGFSYAAGTPVSSLTGPQAAFAIADDLYRITQFPAVLPSFEAPLEALLKPAKTGKKATTLGAGVSSLSEALRKQSLINKVSFPKSLPLHFALNKCEEVSGADAWTTAFGTVTALDASFATTPEKLAAQFYLEKMLAWQLEG